MISRTEIRLMSYYTWKKGGFFTHFQLKRNVENAYKRYCSIETLKQVGLRPIKEYYDAVNIGVLENSGYGIDIILEKLYDKINTQPQYYLKASVSDVFELYIKGQKTFYYIDSIGFAKLESF